ncbi:hypothetical protein FF1_038355 [Malus domestica]
MGTSLLSPPIPLSHFPHTATATATKTWPQFHPSTTTLIKTSSPSSKSLTLLSSTSSPSSVAEDDDSLASPSQPPTQQLPLSGCKSCGREEVEKGCNGEGRIQGGIATFPGFGWWPIKAYRPCPGFVESGGRYRRQGQSLDEVAFGRGGRRD